MPKYSVGYSTTGISTYMSKLNKISDIVSRSTINNKLDDIGARYVEVAQNNLKNSFHTQRDGDLLASEIYYRINSDNSLSIVAGMTPEFIEQLYYAEFGAGMVDSKHPFAKKINWQYDVNKHGDKGWRYYSTSNDKVPLASKDEVKSMYESGQPFRIQKKNGKYMSWVTSSEPTLFMYNTQRKIISDGYIPKMLVDSIRKAYKNRG